MASYDADLQAAVDATSVAHDTGEEDDLVQVSYTALTRARSSVVLWATPDALSRVLDRRVWRDSGLAARLRAIHG